MDRNDKTEIKRFTETWIAACEIYNSSPSDTAILLSFNVLSQFDIEDVIQAIGNYLQDPANGKYSPRPANIVEIITRKNNNDGRPGADEAWAIAIESMDEANTVVMNDDIAAALQVAATIYHDGDRTGARMAFRSAYEREVEQARTNGTPVKWFPSLGHDQHGRQDAIQRAVEKGLLSAPHVQTFLPEPITEEGLKTIEKVTQIIVKGATKQIGSDAA